MNKKIIKFDFCVAVEELLEFVETNSNLEWNNICDLEYKYKKQVYGINDFENEEAYPMVNLGETDDTKFQYWVDKFLETYKDEIGDKQIYLLHN